MRPLARIFPSLIIFILFINYVSFGQPSSITHVLLKPTIEILKLEPERPIEGRAEKIYFKFKNLTPNTVRSGWISANYMGVHKAKSDVEISISNVAYKDSVLAVLSIMTPKPEESSRIS